MCYFYNGEQEANIHAVVSCHFSEEVWSSFSLGYRQLGISDFASWFISLVGQFSGENLNATIMILWAIWEVRNNVVWKNRWSNP